MKNIIIGSVLGMSLISGSAFAEIYSSNIELYKIDSAGKSQLVSSTSSVIPDNGERVPVSIKRTVPVEIQSGESKTMEEGVKNTGQIFKTEQGLIYNFDYEYAHVNLISQKQAFQEKYSVQQSLSFKPSQTYEFNGEHYLLKVRLDKVEK